MQTHVLVMATAADPGATSSDKRIEQLLSTLAGTGIPVVRGPDVGGYPGHPELHDAGALLLVDLDGTVRDPLPYPASWCAPLGVVAIATMAGDAATPEPNSPVAVFDLRNWPGDGASAFDRMSTHLRALTRCGYRMEPDATVDDYQVGGVRSAIEELEALSAGLGDLGEVLSDDEPASVQLRQTLAEISGTYRVVLAAIESFVSAGRDLDGERALAFHHLARPFLDTAIRNGRAHCSRIGVRYKRVGGLRDRVEPRVTAEQLAELDRRFARLADADGDVFAHMDQLGRAMRADARTIERLLATGRAAVAQQYFAEALGRLEPLEDDLHGALSAFQDAGHALGWAEPVPEEKVPVHVTNKTITINGNVVNSNVVVADSIERSSIVVAQSEVSDELKAALQALHEATATLTAHLPADEAELAVRDLTDLATEATSASPRPAFWRRAADGLIAAAKGVIEHGTPVIDFVAKVTALLA